MKDSCSSTKFNNNLIIFLFSFSFIFKSIYLVQVWCYWEVLYFLLKCSFKDFFVCKAPVVMQIILTGLIQFCRKIELNLLHVLVTYKWNVVNNDLKLVLEKYRYIFVDGGGFTYSYSKYL